MKPTVALTLLGIALLGALVAAERSKRGETPPRVRLEGDGAKLLDGHRVTFHSSRREVKPFSVAAEEFPLEVATKDFGAAYLDIENKAGERVAAVLFDRPLVERFNDTHVNLGKPSLETTVWDQGRRLVVHNWAWIDKKVCYAAMPRQDHETGKLIEAVPPTVELRLRGEEQKSPLVVETMKDGCCGYGWIAFVDLPDGAAKGTELTIRIVHDTGDLFGKLTSVKHHVVQ
jgi:hypothetical protein